MAKTPKRIFDDKMDFLDNAENSLKKSASVAERWLFRRILEDIIPELQTDANGQIVNNATNVNILTNKLNSVFRTFGSTQNKELVTQILGDFQGISALNTDYFTTVTGRTADEFLSVKKRVEVLMQRSLGIQADGTIKPNSFISGITSNDAINEEIREIAVRNIQGGNTIKDFTAELSDAIKTDKDGLGVLNRHYRQTVQDRYSQYERAESKTYADVLKLQAFIYSGGKVQDTRRFCCQRNGLVFTRDEAQKWRAIDFQGKNKGYVPLVDLGGYNCRHSTQWITNAQALRRRPDLKLNDEGKLVPDRTKPKQKLKRGCK